MMNYSLYMVILGLIVVISISILSFMFLMEVMESVFVDVGVDVFVDLNGIMMDYDNFLF